MAVSAARIASFLGRPLVGEDLELIGVKPVTCPEPGSLIFAKKWSDEICEALNGSNDILVLAAPEFEGRLSVSHVITPRPRLAFARTVEEFFSPPRRSGIAGTALIAPDAKLGQGVSIGNFCSIGEGVQIGDGTVLHDSVVISDRCIVGSRCLVKSGTVIGEKGFGFDFDEDDTPVAIPHVGRVVIGDDCEIGALNTIARGTLGDTSVHDHVKTDDHVHIAHNCEVGAKTVIAACAEISGSVRIGEKCWIGPNASIINGVEIGDEVMVGIGAVVTKAVRPNVVVAGNPARVVKKEYRRR